MKSPVYGASVKFRQQTEEAIEVAIEYEKSGGINDGTSPA
jgi:hypothetical protein